MLIRRLTTNRFANMVFDIVAIVIGISLSFMLAEWKDDRRLARKQRQVLQNIVEALENDNDRFEAIYKWNETRVGNIDLLRDTTKASSVSSDTLTTAMESLLSFSGQFAHALTFQRISDDLVQLIANPSIREKLLFYYVYVTGYQRDDSLISFQLALDRFQFERTSIPFDTELVQKIGDSDPPMNFEWTVHHKYQVQDILLLTKNREFQNQLSQLKRSCQQTIATLKWAQQKALELRSLIQHELNSTN